MEDGNYILAPMNTKFKLFNPSQGERLSILGDDQCVKLTGQDTNGAFTLIEQNPLPGVGVPMHLHEREDETFHILEGAVTFETEGKTLIAEPGQTIFLPRQIPHAWRVESVQSRMLIICSPAGIEAMFRELSQLPAGAPEMEKVFGICAKHGVRFV